MNVGMIPYKMWRTAGIFEAHEILNSLRRDVVHDRNEGWERLYGAAAHLQKQVELKEAA